MLVLFETLHDDKKDVMIQSHIAQKKVCRCL